MYTPWLDLGLYSASTLVCPDSSFFVHRRSCLPPHGTSSHFVLGISGHTVSCAKLLAYVRIHPCPCKSGTICTLTRRTTVVTGYLSRNAYYLMPRAVRTASYKCSLRHLKSQRSLPSDMNMQMFCLLYIDTMPCQYHQIPGSAVAGASPVSVPWRSRAEARQSTAAAQGQCHGNIGLCTSLEHSPTSYRTRT